MKERNHTASAFQFENQKPRISFCITAYNQSELVKQCIESIISYPGNDIEIVVSDDCSSEDIMAVVRTFDDSRIKYYRCETNLGHDLNILHSFEKANGEYLFLLRSRDRVISSSIPYIIEVLDQYSEISYLTGTGIDEDGYPVIGFPKDELYHSGIDAWNKHRAMSDYIHPSGFLVRKSRVDIPGLRKHLISTIEPKYSFIVHDLIRISIVTAGDMFIISKPTWIYSQRSDDIAENRTNNRISVFDSIFLHKRLECELVWAFSVLQEPLLTNEICRLFFLYMYYCTWLNKQRYQDEAMSRHYGYELKEICVTEERNRFLIVFDTVIKRYNYRSVKFTIFKYISLFKNLTWHALLYYRDHKC